MPTIRQSLQGVQRHAARRAIERAAGVFTYARWFVCGLLVLPYFVFRAYGLSQGFIYIGLFFTLIVFSIAHFLSSPFEGFADDIRNRRPGPLLYALIPLGIVLSAEAVATVFLVLNARSMLADEDGLSEILVIAALLSAFISGTCWASWVFISAWRAINALKLDNLQGFEVKVAGVESATAQVVPPPPSFTLPPRPKR